MPYSDPRYHILKTLRKGVGQELGWPLPKNRAFLGGVWVDGPAQQTGIGNMRTSASGDSHQHNEDRESGMDATRDSFLTGDPMDLLQWDVGVHHCRDVYELKRLNCQLAVEW